MPTATAASNGGAAAPPAARSARAVFNGPNLALRDQDTTCNDGSHWYADQLVCRRGADNVADCQGYSQGAFGPTSWLVNLHRIN